MSDEEQHSKINYTGPDLLQESTTSCSRNVKFVIENDKENCSLISTPVCTDFKSETEFEGSKLIADNMLDNQQCKDIDQFQDTNFGVVNFGTVEHLNDVLPEHNDETDSGKELAGSESDSKQVDEITLTGQSVEINSTSECLVLESLTSSRSLRSKTLYSILLI